MKWVKINSISKDVLSDTFDIWNNQDDCKDGQGNFLLNGSVVHNSIPEAVANRDDPHGLWRKRLAELHPAFLEILGSTYGVIVFQEQLQALWQNIAGFTAPEAQEARKAVAKKWTHKLKPIEKKWITGAGKSIGEQAAKEWWDKMKR